MHEHISNKNIRIQIEKTKPCTMLYLGGQMGVFAKVVGFQKLARGPK